MTENNVPMGFLSHGTKSKEAVHGKNLKHNVKLAKSFSHHKMDTKWATKKPAFFFRDPQKAIDIVQIFISVHG